MAQTGVEGAHLKSNFLSEKFTQFCTSVVKPRSLPTHTYFGPCTHGFKGYQPINPKAAATGTCMTIPSQKVPR